MRKLVLMSAGVLLLALATMTAAMAVNYTIQDLGTLDGYNGGIDPWAVNESGEVVGQCNVGGATWHGFLWSSGRMRDLGTLGGSGCSAFGINDHGQVVGSAQRSDGSYRAFVWDQGFEKVLGTLGGRYSDARAINNSGQVVGWSHVDGSNNFHAFLWDEANGMRDLDTLGGPTSVAYAINDAGQVVGRADAPDRQQAFIWDSMNGMRSLGPLGSSFSEARGINNAGQVVGYYDSYDGGAGSYGTRSTALQTCSPFPALAALFPMA
jgi:probable HAF family extracellular repeat protein